MSRIAVLGWGSLIWDPGSLAITGDWHKDGPVLPIEFARVSKGNRLTLVIHPEADPIPTLWAMMSKKELGDARDNLRVREGEPPLECIGWVCRDDAVCGKSGYEHSVVIREWMVSRGIDCVIWTALECNFPTRLQEEFSVRRALCHLQKLSGQERQQAEEYIRRAPAQVRTRVRQAVEETLGWHPITGE